MSVLARVKIDNILQWARFLNEVPKNTRAATARAMNDYGAGVADSTAEAIAGQTGLSSSEVRALIDVKEATAEHLVWEMDASQVAPPPQDWQRPWEARSNKAFEQQTLVKIVTSGDEHTCEICEEAEANSPYTMEEINAMAQRWKHWQPPTGFVGTATNLLHPNCRCITQPFRSARRVSVSFGGHSAPTELLTARQLGQRVASEIKVSIKAIK